MKFIDEISALLATTDGSDASDSELHEVDASKDYVVGVCDGQTLALLARIQALAQVRDDYKGFVTGEGCEKHPNFSKWRGECYVIEEKIRILDSLFWIRLHEIHPELLAKSNTAIRKGWKVVWFDSKKDSQPKSSVNIIAVGVRGVGVSSIAGKN